MDQDAAAVALVFGVLLKHRIQRATRAGKEVDNDVAAIWRGRNLKNTAQEARRLGGFKHHVRIREIDRGNQLLLGFLRVADFLIGPERLGYSAFLNIGEEPL